MLGEDMSSAGVRWRAGTAVAPSASGRSLRELPREERPRERMARLGPGSLSSRELIAAVIGTGAPGASALEVAEALVGPGLRALAARSLAELETVRGLGRAKAVRLLAALELGARLASDRGEASPSLQSPAEAARYLLPRYSTRPVETFGLLALDTRHRLRREAVVSVGSLSASLVHPREVFQEAVVSRAAALVLFHNHPSGDPEPSAEDLALTRRLAAAGALMGIEVLDHLVLGAGRYVSLKDRGLL
jgi:DNA repair protein RadC